MTRPKPQHARVRMRTGCRTCRLRRIKCNEQRPECQRCKITGRTCDGYELPAVSVSQKAQRQPRALIPRTSPLPIGAITADNIISLLPTLNARESECFQSFIGSTAQAISGYFGSSLWDRFVLQLTNREPSVLHAVIAAGSMHIAIRERSTAQLLSRYSVPSNTFAISHYLKSLTSLRARIDDAHDPASVELALIVCVLFICLEMLQGNGRGAVTHLETGLRVLLEKFGQSRQADKGVISLHEAPSSASDELISMFARLDMDSLPFAERSLDGSAISPHLISTLQGHEEFTSTKIPASFTSILQARQYLEVLANAWGHLSGDLLSFPSPDLRDPDTDFAVWRCYQCGMARKAPLSQALETRLKSLRNGSSRWASAYRNLRRRGHMGSDTRERSQSLLLMRHACLRLSLLASQNQHEMTWDKHRNSFKEIVAQADIFVHGNSNRSGKPNTQFDFMLESGCVPALYLVAIKCRDPVIRRKAITLLKNMTCQEGMWNGRLIAYFVEKFVHEEEKHLESSKQCASSDIPENFRYIDIVMAGCEGRPGYGRLILGRYRHETDGEYEIKEIEFQLI